MLGVLRCSVLVLEGVKCKDELVYTFAETMKELCEFPEISRETTDQPKYKKLNLQRTTKSPTTTIRKNHIAITSGTDPFILHTNKISGRLKPSTIATLY